MQNKYEFRIYAPLGHYPKKSIHFGNSLLFISEDLIYSVSKTDVSLFEKDCNISWMTSEDICMSASLILGSDDQICSLYSLPNYITDFPELRKHNFDFLTPKSADLLKKELIRLLKSKVLPDYLTHLAPPIFDGIPYGFVNETNTNEIRVVETYKKIDRNNIYILRGLKSIVRSRMLSRSNFLEEAAIQMYIGLESMCEYFKGIISSNNIKNPTMKDHIIPYMEEYFPNPYSNHIQDMLSGLLEDRIKSIHPNSRYGSFLHIPLQIDDYYDNFYEVVNLYNFLITGHVNWN